MTTPVTITVHGPISRESIADLFELAARDGLALMVQPRPVVEAAPLPALPAPKARRVVKVAKVARKAKPTPKPRRVKPAPAPVVSAPTGRVFATKDCVTCDKPFVPSGPNSKTCARCRAEFKANVLPNRGEELEIVWDGSHGRNGASRAGARV